MLPHQKLLIRAAMRIQEQYSAAANSPVELALPRRAWSDLERAARRLENARRRGWQFAARRLHDRLRTAAHALRLETEAFALRGIEVAISPIVPTFRELYEELVALHDEFEEVTIRLREASLTVRTEPVVLEDFDFGPFDMRLNWRQFRYEHPCDVTAVEPRPYADDSGVVHPHVTGETLCAGEGRVPMRTALQRGRLCDYFLIVDRILNTYNPGSAYASPENWDGSPCTDCGASLDDDDVSSCRACGSLLCGYCATCCHGCDDGFCGECSPTDCCTCKKLFCSGCLATCPDCKGEYCAECLNADESGRCGDCHTAEVEDGEETGETRETDPAEAAPAGSPAAPETVPAAGTAPGVAVQSDRLGQAVVPA